MSFPLGFLAFTTLSSLAYYGFRIYATDCDLNVSTASDSPVPAAFKNKRIWVTGASSGIGKELGIQIAKLGGTVLLSARSEQGLLEVKKLIEEFQGKCEILVLDLADLTSLSEKVVIARKLLGGDVDILVNNGGVSQRGFANTTKFEVDEFIMKVNYFSAVILTKALLTNWLSRPNKDSDPKGVINVSSLAGKLGTPLRTAYSGSKFALLGFMDALRTEVFDSNIVVTNICPGSVATNISKNALKGTGEKFGVTDSNIAKGMKVERCVKLILRAYANKITEIWAFGNPNEKAIYLAQYAPGLFQKLFLRFASKLKERALKIIEECEKN